jgi:hypothetical protein
MILRKRTSSLHSLSFWLGLAFPTRLSTNQVWPVSKSSRVNVNFGFLERAMGIERTSEAWEALNKTLKTIELAALSFSKDSLRPLLGPQREFCSR